MEIEVISGNRGGNVLPAITVNSYNALFVPQWWRATDFISGNLASFPIGVYVDEFAIETDHYLDPIFTRRANPEQAAHAVLKTWFFHGENTGNGYLFIRRDPITSRSIAIYNLMPEDVTPYRLVPEDGNIFDAQIWYWHTPSHRPFPAQDILHYRPYPSHDAIVSYNPCDMFSSTFSRAVLLDQFKIKYLRKGTMVRGTLELPAGTTKAQATEMVEVLKIFKASADNDRDVPVLPGGAKLTNTTISPVDSQLSLMEPEITKRISQITGVDGRFLMEFSDTKYNAASVQAIGQDLIRYTFRTRIENIEDEITLKMLSEDEQDNKTTLRMDTSALQRGDDTAQMTLATTGVNQGLMLPDEGREAIGLKSLDDPKNNALRIPTNLVAKPDAPTESDAPTKPVAPAEAHSEELPEAADAYAAFRPLLADASKRVETKTDKALATAAKKPEAERIIATNVLAEQQASYAREAFGPINQAITSIAGKTIDLDKLAEQYSAEVRRRAAGHEAKTLDAYIGDLLQ